MDYTCPSCHHWEQAEKLSVAYKRGIAVDWFSDSRGNTVFAIRQTAFSAELAMPEKPTYESPWGCVSLYFAPPLFLMGIVGIICTLDGLVGTLASLVGIISDLGGSLQVLAVGLPCLLISGLFFWPLLKQTAVRRAYVKKELPRWEKANQKWDRLYCCPKCEGIYLPDGQSKFIPKKEANKFLYDEN